MMLVLSVYLKLYRISLSFFLWLLRPQVRDLAASFKRVAIKLGVLCAYFPPGKLLEFVSETAVARPFTVRFVGKWDVLDVLMFTRVNRRGFWLNARCDDVTWRNLGKKKSQALPNVGEFAWFRIKFCNHKKNTFTKSWRDWYIVNTVIFYMYTVYESAYPFMTKFMVSPGEGLENHGSK